MDKDHILLLHGERNLYDINIDKKYKTGFKTGDTSRLGNANIMEMEVLTVAVLPNESLLSEGTIHNFFALYI
jgi:hypothetical protein